MALGDYLKAEKLVKLPWYQKALILGVIALIIVILYMTILDRGYKAQITALKGQISTLDKNIADLRSVEKDLPKFERQNALLKKQLDKAMTKLPGKTQIDALLKEVTERAKNNAIDITTFERGKDVTRDLYVEVPVNIKMKGAFFPMLIFLDELARLERIVNIQDLDLKADSNRMLDVSCVLVAYRFKETEAAPEGGKAKGGKAPAGKAPAGKGSEGGE